MLENHELPQDDRLSQLLGNFSPEPATIDRDQLMFLAGRQAAESEAAGLATANKLRVRLWTGWTVLATAAAILLAVFAWQRPERIVYVDRPANPVPVPEQQLATQTPNPQPQPDTPTFDPSPVAAIPDAANYLLQRQRVVADGPQALSFASPGPGSTNVGQTPTQRQWAEELPGEYRKMSQQVSSDSWWQPWLLSGDRS
jgi:hypothetical protein